jgi:hypothetical protein
VTPGECRDKLDAYSSELDQLSRNLANVERQMLPVEEEFTKFVDDYELGLYARSIEDDTFKLPAEKLRHKLAVRAMDPDLYGRHTALDASRKRIIARIGHLKTLVDAQRSILSALKAEMDGAR